MSSKRWFHAAYWTFEHKSIGYITCTKENACRSWSWWCEVTGFELSIVWAGHCLIATTSGCGLLVHQFSKYTCIILLFTLNVWDFYWPQLLKHTTLHVIRCYLHMFYNLQYTQLAGVVRLHYRKTLTSTLARSTIKRRTMWSVCIRVMQLLTWSWKVCAWLMQRHGRLMLALTSSMTACALLCVMGSKCFQESMVLR